MAPAPQRETPPCKKSQKERLSSRTDALFSVLLAAVGGLHPLLVVQDGLAHPQALGRDLQQLVVRQELQALLQTHLPGRHQPQRLVGAGGPHIGHLLLAAHVDRDILLLGGDAHDHALVHRHARPDKQRAALLCVEQAVAHALAGLKRHQRAGAPAGQIALVGGVAVKHAGHDALAAGIGQKLVAIAEQAAAGNEELDLHTAAHWGHLQHIRLAAAQLLDDRTHALAGHVHHQPLDGLALLPVDGLIQHPRGRHLKLIALAAHGLNEDGQAHLAAPRHVEGVGGSLDLRHPQGHILQRLAEQPLPQLAGRDELALPSGIGGIVDGERHLHGGRADLHEGQRLHAAGRADGVADGDVADTAEGDDVARRGLGDGLLTQSVELIHADGLGPLGRRVGIVVVAHRDLLILPEHAPLHAADGDAPHELVVVDGADQHLERLIQIGLRRGDIVQNGVEQRLEVGALHVGGIAGRAVAGGAEQHGAVQLLGGGVQIQQQLQHLVHYLVDALIRPVDLVDDHDHAVPQLQRAAEDKAGLGHRPLGGVHQQDDAVDHLQDTLHLAAEVGVARGIHDVDLGVAVLDGGVLGQNGDAALTLQVVGVHDALHRLLVLAVHAALLEHLVHQRGLAVVNVGDDRHISQFLVLQRYDPFLSGKFTNLCIICSQTGECKPFPPLFSFSAVDKSPPPALQ